MLRLASGARWAARAALRRGAVPAAATRAPQTTMLHLESAIEPPRAAPAAPVSAAAAAARLRAGAALLAVMDPLAACTPVGGGAGMAVEWGLPSSAPAARPAEEEDAGADDVDGGAWRREGALGLMNRNARGPRPANHGARPCSHVRRKRKVRPKAGDHWGMPTKTKKGCDSDK
jgi:hypothetical protein